MFLHGGFLHLLGNMWFLYIFGDNVEDRLGPSRFLAFYILSGMAAALIHLVTNWHSPLPTIGASGAIAGVMGAYFLLFPRARVLTMVPIFFFPLLFELPAIFFLGYWVLIQFFYASVSGGQAGGVAWWAHIGGFIFGLGEPESARKLPLRYNGERRHGSNTSTPRWREIWIRTGPLSLRRGRPVWEPVNSSAFHIKGKRLWSRFPPILAMGPASDFGTWARPPPMGNAGICISR
jgi:hypothetical protein